MSRATLTRVRAPWAACHRNSFRAAFLPGRLRWRRRAGLDVHNSGMSTVEISPARGEERVTIQNLSQLYAYDWSELLALDVGEDGRFRVGSLDAYQRDERCHP